MSFRLEVEHVRPIKNLVFEIDLSNHGLRCIAGKNGTGKTTLAKAIMNLAMADTFVRTSSEGVFDANSTIRYKLGDEEYLFTYDPDLRSITTRKLVSDLHKAVASVELPAPYGQRFTFFRTLADQDEAIRQAVVLDQYEKPTALIEFLSLIYQDQRFDDLVQVQFRRGVCCCLVKPDKRYIREDYFSSGEYFLINLFRKVTQGTPFVVIDEIDVSLDASTQARLAQQLRTLCAQHKSTVLFTSHSLALMQTLEPGELYYLDRDEVTGTTTLAPMSFNGVKSMLFQFKGFDRYILTEDDVLKQFLEYTIRRYCSPTFYSFQIICLGGQGYITGLMNKNIQYEFLGPSKDVIGIKDGDQAGQKQPKQIYCMPLPNVEKALWNLYREPEFSYRFEGGEQLEPKRLYGAFTRSKRLSYEEIFDLLCNRHETEMAGFARILADFLCRSQS
nr:AAA family ATPase [uncultured Rhodoferax sp.]